MHWFFKFYIRCFCKKIHEDYLGNEYFISPDKNYLGKNKRFVIYSETNRSLDTSYVPALEHAWLHYLIDKMTPYLSKSKPFPWEKKHKGNLSGTKKAHNPYH